MAGQQKITQWADNRTLGEFETADDWPPWDEYGPTMSEPLPEREQIENWERRLQCAGFSWSVLREEESHGGLPDYHITDRDRPEDRDRHRLRLEKIEASGRRIRD